MSALTVLDLFCGCGGISWGLKKAGFSVVGGIDVWEQAMVTFRLNHPEADAVVTDITSLDPSDVAHKLGLAPEQLDCMVGGPPCQGFSKNVPAAYRFLEDPKNQLFRYFLKFVDVLRPKSVLMENVAEIYNAYAGSVREEIVDALIGMGYDVKVAVLFAPDFGVPQRRRRCFFFASSTGVAPAFPPPMFAPDREQDLFGQTPKYISAWSAISDLPVLHNGEGTEPLPYDREPENEYQALMRQGAGELYDHVTRKLNAKQMARVTSLGPGEGIKQLPAHLRPKSGYSGAYGRLDFTMLAPTITRWVFHPGSGRYCHPREARLITIREGARLQSFSDDFRFTGAYIEKAHQVGNAVPPLLITRLAPKIRECCLGRPPVRRGSASLTAA